MELERATKLVEDAIMGHLYKSPGSYNYNATYRDLGADSLDEVKICMIVEEHLDGKQFTKEQMNKLHTVRDLISLLERDF